LKAVRSPCSAAVSVRIVARFSLIPSLLQSLRRDYFSWTEREPPGLSRSAPKPLGR
jgi:hypothetical protein